MFITEAFLKAFKSPPLMFLVSNSYSKEQPGTGASVLPLSLSSGDCKYKSLASVVKLQYKLLTDVVI